MLFRFRDSLNLLPGKLSELAKNLCPDLGTKGSIPYDEVKDLEVRKTLYYSPRSIFPLFFCSFNALLVDWKCGETLLDHHLTSLLVCLDIHSRTGPIEANLYF
ncbi:hypothetical protein V6N13_061529 [Hibiscus sabdariffa]